MTSRKLIFGVGRVTSGPHKATRKHGCNAYGIWYAMLGRCYMDDSQRGAGNRHYSGCTVSEEWLNFQEFAAWYVDNYVVGFHLDKDILYPGNKIYSKETCGFVPVAINVCLSHTRRKNRTYDLPTGVSFCSVNKKYQSTISLNGRSVSLGLFLSQESARAAYLKKKKEHLVSLAEQYRSLMTDAMYLALLDFPVEGVS